MRSLCISAIGAVAVAFSASAEMMDRPGGFRIGQRLTIRPYVSFSATYDSNVGSNSAEDEDVIWTVNPGLNFEYRADRWYLLGSGYYSFNAYSKDHKSNTSDYHNYGQTLTFGWDTSSKEERGWSLILNESFRLLNETDDITLSDGSTYGRDSQQFNFTGVLERRITEHLHASVNAGYYWLDYDNSNSSAPIYGWSRWTGGAEIGYAASKWFDLLLAASYQDYSQDNTKGHGIGKESNGTTLHIGFGSYATERISYRLLAGWTRFEYASGADTSNGMTYSISGKWQIGETWNLVALSRQVIISPPSASMLRLNARMLSALALQSHLSVASLTQLLTYAIAMKATHTQRTPNVTTILISSPLEAGLIIRSTIT